MELKLSRSSHEALWSKHHCDRSDVQVCRENEKIKTFYSGAAAVLRLICGIASGQGKQIAGDSCEEKTEWDSGECVRGDGNSEDLGASVVFGN